MLTLGISAFTHDSSICLIKGNEILTACEEERFSRKKHDGAFPMLALKWAVNKFQIDIRDLDQIAFFEKPYLRFERMLKTWLYSGVRSWPSLRDTLPLWLHHRLPPKNILAQKISDATGWGLPQIKEKLIFFAHHQSHAASAFYASSFEEAAILVMDGVGEWSTTTIWKGTNNQLQPLLELQFPHSIGLFYSAFTGYLGFRILSGEYKLMGLAAYGEPRFVDLLKSHVITVHEDGGVSLNLKHLDFLHPTQVVRKPLERLLGFSSRNPSQKMENHHQDLAASVQFILEEVVQKLVNTAHKITGANNLCLAGGVALNCRANGKLLNQFPDLNFFVQPASSDAGGSLGAACLGQKPSLKQDLFRVQMKSCYLGIELTESDVQNALTTYGIKAILLQDEDLVNTVAVLLNQDQIVGWARGKMEYGPRALGARSILANPKRASMKDRINTHIKQREAFRPFAPIVPLEDSSLYFDITKPSPHMLFAVSVKTTDLPAITHIDNTARVQTIAKGDNPLLWELLHKFKGLSGVSVLLNTSFNLRGEPIAATAEDCLKSFLMCRLDALVLGNFLILRSELPEAMLSYKHDEIEAD